MVTKILLISTENAGVYESLFEADVHYEGNWQHINITTECILWLNFPPFNFMIKPAFNCTYF